MLVVDDDPQLARTLKINLETRGYEVGAARTGEGALSAAARFHPDAIILDLGLPGIDGLKVIEGLRGWSRAPIVVLSAREREQDKIAALDAGADDFVSKPFGMGELLARVRTVLRRRAASGERGQVITTPDFCIDFEAKVATVRGERCTLTPTEWRLIEYLTENSDRLVSHRQILEAVWGFGATQRPAYVHTYMAWLRRKLEPDPSAPAYLLTEPGRGVRFVPHPEGRG